MDNSFEKPVQYYLDRAERALRGANENASNPHLRDLFTELANEWLRLAKFAEANGCADLNQV